MWKLLYAPVLALLLIPGTGMAEPTAGKRAASYSDQIRIADAVLIQPPPGAPVMGGYLSITALQDDRLIGVSGGLSADIQMHSMSHQDGQMRMRRLDAIELPASVPVKLERGGMHLMVMQPFDRPEVGSTVELTLQFEKAGGLRVPFVVQDGRVAADAAGTDEHANHGDHQH